MKLLCFCFFMLCFLTSCSAPQVNNAPEPQKLLSTEYDVFNLKWGQSKAQVESVCNFGGKSAKRHGSVFDYSVDFEKGNMLLRFLYNDRDELYSCEMEHFFEQTHFLEAKNFFFYFLSMLEKKYPNKSLDSCKGYYRYAHLPASIQLEHFLYADYYLMASFETTTTKIDVSLIPLSVSDSLHTRIVFVLTYRSKNIPSAYTKVPQNDSRITDSIGL